MDDETTDSILKPQSCDHVFEARYCVKTTGLFEGWIFQRNLNETLNKKCFNK